MEDVRGLREHGGTRAMLRAVTRDIGEDGSFGRHGEELQRISAVDEHRHTAESLAWAGIILLDKTVGCLPRIRSP